MTRPTVLVVYGTRPEAIKVAPVVRALASDEDVDVQVAVTGQHGRMVDEVNAVFGITAHDDLAVARPGQSLSGIAAACLCGLAGILERDRPNLVLVHGDTTTSTAAALAAYYAGVPVAHLEAGLRSGDLHSPFPEEGNRRMTAQLADIHLAPTASAAANLTREGVARSRIVITGNTVIDALHFSISRQGAIADPRVRAAVDSGRRILLLTGHRRESWSGGLAAVGRGVAQAVRGRKDVCVVAPLHPNPIVRRALEPTLGTLPGAVLTGPMGYLDFCRVLQAAHCVVTDSGGIQEEAPSLGVPVLVTRETTERPEAVVAGAVRLVGVAEDAVCSEVNTLLDDDDVYERMSHARSPYGDGHAAPRVVAALKALLGVGTRIPDFAPMALDA